MRNFDEYEKVIAVKQMSAGNETVGDMWVETKSFDAETPIKEIVNWARNCRGKLIITIDESSVKELKF